MKLDHARQLLDQAFPFGAVAYSDDPREFFSLRHEIAGADGERFNIWFDRNPGDTIGAATAAQLERAAGSGQLVLDTGCRIRRPEASDAALLGDPFAAFVGPQAASDSNDWIRRMRLHQSWWRAFHLRTPFGVGPNRGGQPRGSMLDDAGGEGGWNFLSDDARAAYDDRVAVTKEGVSEWRTRRNLLASQPMAFNLFGHLSRNLDLATETFAGILGADEVAAVTSIDVERLSTALGDRTAFDAFATYRRPDGTDACLAIETKLTEPFSQQAYDWERYTGHAAFSPDVWDTTDTVLLGDLRWAQLWRNHLLGIAESNAEQLGPVTVLVVHHALDPSCAEAIDGYRQLLHDPEQVRPVDLGAFYAAVSAATLSEADARWIDEVRIRYLDLHRSAPLVTIREQAGR
jgi:hypothetical protein